jgi:hypothetical protein
MSKKGGFLSNFIERTGLDWFVLLIGKPAFVEDSLPYPTTLKEIREKFGDLTEKEKLKDAMEYCAILLDREEKRSDKVESKAFTLIGITGIAAGFIIGFAGLLLDQGKIPSDLVLVLAAVLYILVVLSLMWAIFLSVKVVTVGDYTYTYPSANDIFDLADSPLQSVQKERAASLFFSFVQNHRVVNRKATFLNGSQLWFRNSIFLLLLLTLLLAFYIPFKANMPVTGATLAPITATRTLTPTKAITVTSTPPSITPTAELNRNYPVAPPSGTVQP